MYALLCCTVPYSRHSCMVSQDDRFCLIFIQPCPTAFSSCVLKPLFKTHCYTGVQVNPLACSGQTAWMQYSMGKAVCHTLIKNHTCVSSLHWRMSEMVNINWINIFYFLDASFAFPIWNIPMYRHDDLLCLEQPQSEPPERKFLCPVDLQQW